MRRMPNCSCTPNERDSSTTHIGTVAMRMPVTEELIHCSPKEIAANGIANSARAKRKEPPRAREAEPSAPRFHAIGTRTAAASTTRHQAISNGGTSATASLMKKYGIPQITHKAANAVHALQLTIKPRRSPLAPNCINCTRLHSTADRESWPSRRSTHRTQPRRAIAGARPRGRGTSALGSRDVISQGISSEMFQDLYHYFMTVSWPRLFATIAAFFLVFDCCSAVFTISCPDASPT